MSDRTLDHPGYPRYFFAALVVGWGIMGFGIWGLFANAGRTNPDQWVRWFVGAALVHDLLIAPAILVGGRVLRRSIPGRWLAPLQGASIAALLLAAATFPFLLGYGRRPDNPSILPNDYWTAFGWALFAIAVVAGLAGLRRRRR